MSRGGKRQGAGRPKGSANVRTIEIQKRLDELDCDPIEGMARIGKEAEQRGDYQLAGQMYKELAQYIAPKRRATELTADFTTTHDQWVDILAADREAGTAEGIN